MKPERTHVRSAVARRAPLIPRRLSRDDRARVRALLDGPPREAAS
jgi:hypothetical protein